MATHLNGRHSKSNIQDSRLQYWDCRTESVVKGNRQLHLSSPSPSS